MKRLITFIILVIGLAPIVSIAQSQIQLQYSVDSLVKINAVLKNEISENESKISEFREKLMLNEANKNAVNSVVVKLTKDTKILKEKFVLSDTIAKARKNEIITIIGYDSDYFITNYMNKIGYVHYYALPLTDDLNRFRELALRNKMNNESDLEKQKTLQKQINTLKNQKIEDENRGLKAINDSIRNKTMMDSIQKVQDKERALSLERQKKRKADIIKKYGQTIGQKILDGRIWIGMTSEMAKDSWGLPEKNNRTVNQYKIREQWVYSSSYLYFEDGILTSWQD